MFKILLGDGGVHYAVFENEEEAEKMWWLFGKRYHCMHTCFGGYFNAYKLK